MIESLWLVLLGFAAGAAGSMVGFGGGIMIAPALTFMGFPPSLVASSSLFGTFGNLGGATLTHALKRRIRYSLGLKLGLLSIPGTAFGALLAQYAKSDLFSVLLGIILAVSAYMLFRGNGKNDGEKKEEEEEGPKKSGRLTRSMTLMMIMASISAGVVSSFFGIGGGVVIVPFMILVMGMRLKEVVVSSQPALLVIAFVGLAVHGFIGNTDIAQAAFLLVGGFGGGLVGVRLSQRLGGRHLQIILSTLIAVAAIRLFWVSIEEVYGSSISDGSLFILHVLHTWPQI